MIDLYQIEESRAMGADAIAMVGMKGIFKLRAADIFRVTAVTKTAGERIPPAEITGPR